MILHLHPAVRGIGLVLQGVNYGFSVTPSARCLLPRPLVLLNGVACLSTTQTSWYKILDLWLGWSKHVGSGPQGGMWLIVLISPVSFLTAWFTLGQGFI